MTNATASTLSDNAALVSRLVDRLVDTITSPLPEAVGNYAARRITARVALLVKAGNLRDAQQLVTDEITLASLQAEITRHIAVCGTCADRAWDCSELWRMEETEGRLLMLVIKAGGLR